MSRVYVLFNPLSGDGCNRIEEEILKNYFSNSEVHHLDIRTVDDYGGLLNNLNVSDALLICGGDGTLNRFINETVCMEIMNPIYYYPTGNGNDFLRDLGKTSQDGPIQINDYIHNLPCVDVNGKTYRFLNGIGYGIDGYCCEVGEQLRAKGEKPNYTAIAIKGLLFHFKPTKATVVVDGKEYTYRRVWVAPTMHGRYYGGGMNAAPDQQRNNAEGKLSLMLMHNFGRIRTLCIFPSIFQGKHISHTKAVAVHTGTDITVRFDRPVTLQIDGEVVMGVSEYRAYSKIPVKV